MGEIIQKSFSQTTIGKALEQKIIQNKIITQKIVIISVEFQFKLFTHEYKSRDRNEGGV